MGAPQIPPLRYAPVGMTTLLKGQKQRVNAFFLPWVVRLGERSPSKGLGLALLGA